MISLLQILGLVAGIISLVCYILVVIKMFQNDKTGLGTTEK